jgi:hypothetical protein
MAVNFTLVTDLQHVIRRDFYLATPAMADPTYTNPLMDGEFVNLDTAYKLIRGVNGSMGWAVFSDIGVFDAQAIKKKTVLFGQTYEADTRVFTSTSLALGGKLEIGSSVTVDTKTKSGLVVWGSGVVIGYVTRMPANNGGLLRFIQTLV